MKTLTKSITLALLIATMGGSAWADGRRGYFPHGQHRNHNLRGHDTGWIAPLFFLGLAGAPQPIYVQPAPVYTAPVYAAPAIVAQTPPQAPANAWYFCRSVGQYYPYTPHCPEGWQRVSPTPQ